MMKNATDAHEKIATLNEFTLADLKALNDEILFKEEHFFGQKIQWALVAANPLADRLHDESNPSNLPFPFVLSPARKSLLEKLLPLPERNVTIIEGFSQAGKSNFGCHLALMYRMQKKKNVVMYIGNMNDFNENPSLYVLRELFYWFYEKIADDLMLQNLMLQYLHTPAQFGKKTTEYLKWLIVRLVQLSTEKGKPVFVVIDQFNLKNIDGEANDILHLLASLANRKIYITTNTDNKIDPIKRPDGGYAKVLVLNEIENPIKHSELSKLVMKLFPQSKDDFLDAFISKMEGNLNLIFLFYNYYVKKFSNLQNAELLQKCEEFCLEYIRENRNKHLLWRKETARFESEDPNFMNQLQELMSLLNTNGSVNAYPDFLLDRRYLYIENGRLFSINPLIEKMFQQLYWSANQIEKFLNKYGKLIGGSPFGKIFEYYIILKMQEMSKNKRPLVFKLADGKFLTLDFKEIKKVSYGINNSEKKGEKAKEGENKSYDLITYDKQYS